MTTIEIYNSVDWDRVKGHDEILAIIRTVNKVQELRAEQERWDRDFGTECFIIADHLDFLLTQTFTSHERRT